MAQIPVTPRTARKGQELPPSQQRREATATQTPLGPVTREVQEALGNQRLAALLDAGPSSADELYLVDLLSAEHQTGEDFSGYLPWKAPGYWTDFARAWYRVLWTERSLDAVDAAPAVEAPLLDGSAVDGPALGGAALGGAALGGPAPGAQAPSTTDTSTASAAPAVALDARGPASEQDLDDWIQRLLEQGGGRSATAEEQGFLRAVHGREVPGLRIHEGTAAARAAQAVNAYGFTVGLDVWLGRPVDLSDPQSAELLAHESTHALQELSGRKGPEGLSRPGQPLEVEAEQAGRRARALHAQGPEAWGVHEPGPVDSAGRFLVDWIRGSLPASAPEAPLAAVLDALQALLTERAQDALADQEAALQGLDPASASERQAELAALRVQLDGAAPSPEGFAQLLAVGGVPSLADLQRAQALTPYPTLARQAALTLEALAPRVEAPAGGPSPVEQAQTLLRTLTGAFGLPAGSVSLRLDAEAAARTQALGTRGLMEGGEILLDAAQFDPNTADGRGLLAHEVAHAAQALAPAPTLHSPLAGLAAEAEAQLSAQTFARGGAVGEISVGLPAGHVAAEGGDSSAANLKGLLEQYRALNEQRKGAIQPVEGATGASPNKDGTENREKKVADYTEGVDGIASTIERLDAFDKLTEALGDNADTSGPMRGIKASEPYRQLCDMWQGAKEGGLDRPTLEQAFNDQFVNRGQFLLWGADTAKAFDLIRDNAKADAKPKGEAAAAKEQLNEAKSKENEQNQENNQEGNGEGTGEGNGAGTTPGGPGGAGGDLARLMAEPVSAQQPATPAFDQLGKVTDDQLASIVFERNHQVGLGNEVSSGGLGVDRGSQIWKQLSDNFAGTFTKSFTDQFTDTLILDTLGTAGDKLLSKTPIKTPMVGPMISLFQMTKGNPFSGENWSNMLWGEKGADGQRSGGILDFSGVGKSADSFVKMSEALGQAQNPKDFVGILCAALADWFTMWRDLIDKIAQICGLLSALCYIAGGILIAVGLALVWLAGVGAPLITAGGWMVRAGGILARINTALGLIVIALSAISLMFRTAAAFLVPAELYAAQLGGVGEASQNFADKAGQKVGDKTASNIKGAVANGVKPKPASTDGGSEGGGKPKGEADAQKVRQEHENTNKQLDADAAKLEAEMAKNKGQGQDEGGDTRRNTGNEDPANSKKNQGGEEEGGARKPHVAVRALKALASPITDSLKEMNNSVNELVGGLKEASQLVTRPLDSAAQGTQHLRKDYEDKRKQIDGTTDELRQKVSDAKKNVDAMNEQLQRFLNDSATPGDLADARAALLAAQADLKSAQKKLKDAQRYELIIKGMSGYGGDTQGRRDRVDDWANKGGDKDKLEGERDKKQEELDAEQQKLKEAQRKEAELQKKIGDAEGEVKRTHEELDGAKQKQGQDQEVLKRLDGERQKAQELETRKSSLEQQAADLRKKAINAEKGEKLRVDAEALRKKSTQSGEEAQNHKATAEGYVGKKIKLKFDDGPDGDGMTNRRVIAIEEGGIRTTDGRGNTKVWAFDEIVGPKDLKRAASQYQKSLEAQKKAESDAAKLDAESKNLNPDGTTSKALFQQAEDKGKEAASLHGSLTDARVRSEYDSQSKVSRGELERRMAEQQRQLQQLEGRQQTQQSTLNELKREAAEKARIQENITKLEKELKALEEQVKTAQGAASHQGYMGAGMGGEQHPNDPNASRARNAVNQGRQATANTLSTGSSGNATGGVGSAYKDVGNELLFGLAQSIERSIGLTSALQPKAGAQEPTKTFGGMAEGKVNEWLGIAKQDAAAVKAMGQKQAMVESLLTMSPPEDLELMLEAQQKAIEASKKFQAEHASALMCYQAEQKVSGLADETKLLTEQGKPLHEKSKSLKTPINQAKTTEGQRKSALTQSEPGTKKSEPGLGSIVTDLVAKLASNSDRFSKQPNAGDADAGSKMATAQDSSDQAAKDKTKESSGASDEQTKVLDEALVVQAAQEASLLSNVNSLEEKYNAEVQIKEEIQRQKANHLMARETAHKETEDWAGKFNSSYSALDSWAKGYKAKREEILK